MDPSKLRLVPGRDETPAPSDAVADASVSTLDVARRGDEGAWASLYREHAAAVFGYIVRLVGDRTLADDMTQEVFARALASIDRCDGTAGFRAWIRGIALNLVRMHWRGHERQTRHLARLREQQNSGSPNEPVHAGLEHRRRADALELVLSTLPGHLREAFMLVDVMQCTAKEAAAELGISPGNLRIRTMRARRRVEKELRTLGLLEDRP